MSTGPNTCLITIMLHICDSYVAQYLDRCAERRYYWSSRCL